MYMYIISMFTFQTSQVQIQQQIVIQPSYPKSMKNKSIMCKPFLQTKATSCKPHTQTLGIQTGSTNSLILDCRLCLKRENYAFIAIVLFLCQEIHKSKPLAYTLGIQTGTTNSLTLECSLGIIQ